MKDNKNYCEKAWELILKENIEIIDSAILNRISIIVAQQLNETAEDARRFSKKLSRWLERTQNKTLIAIDRKHYRIVDGDSTFVYRKSNSSICILQENKNNPIVDYILKSGSESEMARIHRFHYAGGFKDFLDEELPYAPFSLGRKYNQENIIANTENNQVEIRNVQIEQDAIICNENLYIIEGKSAKDGAKLPLRQLFIPYWMNCQIFPDKKISIILMNYLGRNKSPKRKRLVADIPDIYHLMQIKFESYDLNSWKIIKEKMYQLV